MEGRTREQCYQKWVALKSMKKKGKWDVEEDTVRLWSSYTGLHI